MQQMLEKNRHKYFSSCGNFIYHIAIIDYLQDFNTDKQVENVFKTVVLRNDKKLLSAIEPIGYQTRFINFMREKVIIDQDQVQSRRSSLKAESRIETSINESNKTVDATV